MSGRPPAVAARTNTMQVLWNSYLRADPLVLAWAEETVPAAVSDAEQAALDTVLLCRALHPAIRSTSGEQTRRCGSGRCRVSCDISFPFRFFAGRPGNLRGDLHYVQDERCSMT
jgi:hypothetical protein